MVPKLFYNSALHMTTCHLISNTVQEEILDNFKDFCLHSLSLCNHNFKRSRHVDPTGLTFLDRQRWMTFWYGDGEALHQMGEEGEDLRNSQILTGTIPTTYCKWRLWTGK